MTYAEMKETIKLIDATEEFIMRPLTDEEKQIFIDKGVEYFYKKVLDLSEEKFHELEEFRRLISAYYTKDKNSFIEFYKDKDHTDGLVGLTKLMEDINWDFVGSQCRIRHFSLDEEEPDETVDRVNELIDDLYAGKEIGPYDDHFINSIIDYLWETNDDIRIEVKNGKMKLIKPVKK